ncbi:OLC1v1006002C1 [Oldenlandia corymbosa var. corymbosa]|uniref:OLC1v1006002C1 n=1 Tax=Oldenlandia corymbosa var. corymbosa TaxID=529605 RepID=A0AAV1DIM7_OLDCO|nr:OLC1v1006002C1 [Oldenlandia corymbosa var. corymbosa]
MAELFVPKIMDQLTDAALKQVGERAKLLMGVKDELRKLTDRWKTIERVLDNAEKRKLKEEDKMSGYDVLDEWGVKILKPHPRMPTTLLQKVRSLIPSLCSCLKQVPVRHDIALKIKEINDEVESILNEANKFHFVTSLSGEVYYEKFNRPLTTSILDVSRRRTNTNKEVDDEKNVKVLSIVGVGGSGKTTLAQLLYNDVEVKKHFDVWKWICVSDPFHQKRIAKALLEGSHHDSSEPELESLLQRIKQSFSGKRFLIVLNDFWTEDSSNWKPFRDSLKDGAYESIILVTTRSEKVAITMGTDHYFNLGLLSQLDCWLIIKKIALSGRPELCHKVERIGQKIAEKCKGLPLAAKIMGSLLQFRDNPREWREVLVTLSYPHNWREVLDNTKIEVEELEVKIDEEDDPTMLSCKMHDIVHDFAQFVARNQCQVFEEDACQKVEVGNGGYLSTERLRHVNIIGTIKTLDSSIIQGIEEVQSLFLSCGDQLPQDLSKSLKSVRSLTLSRCYVRELPGEIGNLFHLRLLNVSHNLFKELPESICDLYYLESLDVRGCWELTLLPERIGDLIHMGNLDTSGSSIERMPRGIGKLTSLRVLTGFIADVDVESSCNIVELKHLNQLERLRIVGHPHRMDFEVAQLENKLHLEYLRLEFDNRGFDFTAEVADVIMERMGIPPMLHLWDYPARQLPKWILLSLENLSFDQLPSLKHLGRELYGLDDDHLQQAQQGGNYHLECHDVDNTVAFLSLKRLSFTELEDWETWEDISDEETEEKAEGDHQPKTNNAAANISIMPRLEILNIKGCRNLEALPVGILAKASSLKTLHITCCDKLVERYSDKSGEDWMKMSHIPNTVLLR